MDTAVNRAEFATGRFKTPKEYVGYRVLDPEGRKIGKVKDRTSS